MVVLHHQLVAFARLHQHFVVHTFEDAAGYGARQLCGVGYVEDVDVFGANHYVHLHLLAKSRVHAFKFVSAEGDGFILYHDSVQDVAFADEVCYEGVDGLVVDVRRHAYLLDASFAHHDDGIAQGQCLFLVVGDVDEGDAQLLVHLLQFHLHVLAHLEVQGGKGLVQQQHFGFVDDGSGNGYALLLPAGEGVHVAVLIVRHAHHAQGLLHLLLDGGTGQLLQLQPEGNVVEHVEVGEEGVLLEHGVHRTLVRRCLCDVLSGNGYHSFRSSLKACNEAQQCCLSAAGRSQYCYKLALTDRQIHIIQHGLVSEGFRYVLHTDDAIGLLHKRLLLYPNELNKSQKKAEIK